MVFDVVVLVIILISALIAFLRGVIREILTIIGVVGGLAAAWYGGPILVPHMEKWLGVKEGVEPEKLLGILPYDILADILAYGSIFIVVVIGLSIVSHVLAEAARSIGLGPVDRTFGVIFGIARGILLLGILYLPFHVVIGQEQKASWFKESKTFFYVEQTSVALAGLLPEATMEKFKEDAQTIKEGVDTREKLQQIDLLKSNGAPPEEELPPAEGGASGYTDQFRDEMDELFETKPGTAPPTAAPPPANPAPNE